MSSGKYPDLETDRQVELLKALSKRLWRTPNAVAEEIGEHREAVVGDLAKLEVYPFVEVRPEEEERYNQREYKINSEIAREVIGGE